jgi:type IVB pilus formation R64 PilN family outer membrane protein
LSAGVWVATACGCLLLGLSGCAIDTLSRQTRDYSRQKADQAQSTARQVRQQVARAGQPDQSETRVNKPWVAGKPMPLGREYDLPVALRTNVKTTLLFRKPSTSLLETANRLAQATGVPVRVSPEALLPIAQFMPRLSAASGAPQVMTPASASMPQGTRPLLQVLDQVAAAHQAHWHYRDGAIEFYRTRTRVFDVHALSVAATASMRLGKAGGQDSQGFDSAAQTELSLNSQAIMEDVVKQLEPFLTRAALVAAQPGSLSSVVITDTPAALDAVGAYLEQLNRRLTRRVRLVFEQVTVTRDQEHEQGIDWQLALASELAGLDVSSLGAGAGAPMIGASAAAGAGAYGGSLVLKAVSRYADVVRHTTVPVMTLNRRPVTHAVRSTFTYVDQVKSVAMGKPDQNGSSALPGIAVNQKRQTVGAFLTLVPDVQDNGQVLLSVAFDNTVAMPLKTLSFGSAAQAVQVQQLDLRGSGTVQQVVLYPGRSTLIAGFEHQANEVDQARRSPHAPKWLGGDDHVKRQSTVTLIFVTAQVQDGG